MTIEEDERKKHRLIGTWFLLGLVMLCAGIYAAFGWPAILIVGGTFCIGIALILCKA
jgi:hypothetical protein